MRMNIINIDDMMKLIAEKSREVAYQTTTDRERFEALRYFASDITDWLQHRSLKEQTQVLETIRHYLKTGETPAELQDPVEQVCFAQLLALIRDPPPVL
jgi:hypothetical protein